jgi:prepilin-type N-terminal cleavage/methylation domain-containing protein
MVGAHIPARCWPVRERGCVAVRPRRRGEESGFSIVELIVVLVIVAILMAAVLPQLNKVRRNTGGPTTNIAAAAIWRGVQNNRIDNGGNFPPLSMLQNGGTTFTDPGGIKYVKRWPQDSKGAPMEVLSGSGTPPTANLPLPAGPVPPGSSIGKVVYFANGTSGWIVAYSDTGRIVYRRDAGPWTAVPAG